MTCHFWNVNLLLRMLTRGHSLNPSLILLKQISNHKPLIYAVLLTQETKKLDSRSDSGRRYQPNPQSKGFFSYPNSHIIFKKDFINPLFLYIFHSLEEISDKDWGLPTIRGRWPFHQKCLPPTS